MAPHPVSSRAHTPVGSRLTADLNGVPEVVQIILSLLSIGQAMAVIGNGVSLSSEYKLFLGDGVFLLMTHIRVKAESSITFTLSAFSLVSIRESRIEFKYEENEMRYTKTKRIGFVVMFTLFLSAL